MAIRLVPKASFRSRRRRGKPTREMMCRDSGRALWRIDKISGFLPPSISAGKISKRAKLYNARVVQFKLYTVCIQCTRVL